MNRKGYGGGATGGFSIRTGKFPNAGYGMLDAHGRGDGDGYGRGIRYMDGDGVTPTGEFWAGYGIVNIELPDPITSHYTVVI